MVRITNGLRWLAILQLVGVAVLFWTGHLKGQSTEILGERMGGLSARVIALEDIKADARLRVIESDMTEVKYLGRTVAVAVAIQLVLAGLHTQRERRRG